VGSENWELEREDGFVAEEIWTTLLQLFATRTLES
jgi:hypothetical protein